MRLPLLLLTLLCSMKAFAQYTPSAGHNAPAAEPVRVERATKEGKNRRKALIVVTDGLDKENYYKFDDVVKHLQEADVQIYIIGFTQDLDADIGPRGGESGREVSEASH